MTWAIVNVLPTRHTEEHLARIAPLQAFGELGNRPLLIPAELEIGDERESIVQRRHGSAPLAQQTIVAQTRAASRERVVGGRRGEDPRSQAIDRDHPRATRDCAPARSTPCASVS